ncbi:N-acetyltransferase [Mobilitalea sibirica]|uniref:N-acetyltransferase n=1 Tax=Mobilitalea sibirica TaxID=1462919 RepID=A0A8J7H019_9FIRM|nr:GNAT family N-acetyltransferase [Mobilitalea sibirica]MBH1939360.1 N-acetyltransferase [Mobilitalea sibirica]
MNTNSNIRMATLEDASSIYAIYEPYILNTAITFEYDPVPVEVFQSRMETVLKQFPWLVYERDGKVLGYAYCAKFKERAAFDWDCECSVYIDEKYHHQGIASALYEKLFDLVKQQGYYTVYALITNHHESSIHLHKKFGFTKVGIYQKTGFKMGKWWDLLVMEKRLYPYDKSPIPPKSINEISY